MRKWKRLTAIMLSAAMVVSMPGTSTFTVSAAEEDDGRAQDVFEDDEGDFYDEDVEYDYDKDDETIGVDEDSAMSGADIEDEEDWEYNDDAEADDYEEADWGNDFYWGDEEVEGVGKDGLVEEEDGYWYGSNFWNNENTEFTGEDGEALAWEDEFKDGFVSYLNSVNTEEKEKYLKVEKKTDPAVEDTAAVSVDDTHLIEGSEDLDSVLKEHGDWVDAVTTTRVVDPVGADAPITPGPEEELGEEEIYYVEDEKTKSYPEDDNSYYLYYPEDMSGETWTAAGNDDAQYAVDGQIDGEKVGVTDSENATYNYGDDYIDSVTDEERNSLTDGADEDEEEGEELSQAVDFLAQRVSKPVKGNAGEPAEGTYSQYLTTLDGGLGEDKGKEVTFAASTLNYTPSSKIYTRQALLKESPEYAYWSQGESKYYYNRLNAAEKALYDQLMVISLRYMMGKTRSIVDRNWNYLKDYVFSNQLSLKQMGSIYKIFRMSNPQFYFLRTGYSYKEDRASNTRMLWPWIYPTFSRGTGRAAMKKRIEAARTAYHKSINGKGWGGATEEERGLAIHNWIVGHVDYDHFAKSTAAQHVLDRGTQFTKIKDGKRAPDEKKTFSQSIYSVFVPKPAAYPKAYSNGVAKSDNIRYYTVCMGYAAAFTLLCNMEGIEAVSITSKGHAWNEVKFRTYMNGSRNNNGSWYMTDCTWDDTGSWQKYPVKRTFQYFERSTHWVAHREKSAKKTENHAIEPRYERFGMESSQPELAPLPDVYFLRKGEYMKNAQGGYVGMGYPVFTSAATSKLRFRYDAGTKKFVQNNNGNYIKHRIGSKTVNYNKKVKYKVQKPYKAYKVVPVKNKKGKVVRKIKKPMTKYKWVWQTKIVPQTKTIPLYVYLRYQEIFNKAGCYRNNGQSNYAWTKYIGVNDDGSVDSGMDEPSDGSGTETVAQMITETSSDSSTSGTTSGSAASITSSSSGSGSSSGSSGAFTKGAVRTAGKGASRADYVRTGKNTVRFSMSTIKGKQKKVVIPATVKIGKKTYKVTSIGKNAFAGEAQLTTIVVGKNIVKIAKGAFSGLPKLKTLILNSTKLSKKSVKGAFAGSAIRTVYVPEEALDRYRKIFTKANTGSKGRLSVRKNKQT